MAQPIPPAYIDRMELQVHGASAVVTLAPPSQDLSGDQLAQTYLSSVVIHRGAHGLRAWQIPGIPGLEDRWRIFFPVTAPNFLIGAGPLFLGSLAFDYEIQPSTASVPSVVVYDGQLTVATFTSFPHNGGNVQINPSGHHSFQEALGVSLILHTPVGELVSVQLTALRILIASSNIAPG